MTKAITTIKQFMPRFLGGTICCFIVSLFLSLCAIVLGGSDFIVFAIMTVFYSSIVGSMSWSLGKLPAIGNEWVKFGVAFLLGIFTSFIWSIAMSLFFGASMRAFNFPAFYIWTISGTVTFSFLLSKQEGIYVNVTQWKNVVLLVTIPFLCVGSVFLLGFAFMKISEATTRPHLYLIPEGYMGPILIVYEQPNGQPPKYQGRTQVYEIDENGILFTQLADTYIGGEFWYVDEAGQKTKQLQWRGSCSGDSDSSGDPLEICLFGGGIGSKDSSGKCFPPYDLIIITYESTQSHLKNNSDGWATRILESPQLYSEC